MIKKLGLAALTGLMLTDGAWAADIKRESSRPVIAQPTAVKPVAANTVDAASGTPVKQTLAYKTMPWIDFDNEMLDGQARQIKIKLRVSAAGRVEAVQVMESTGLPRLDQLIVHNFMRVRFYPYVENGVAIPVWVAQRFEFQPSNRPSTEGLVTPYSA